MKKSRTPRAKGQALRELPESVRVQVPLPMLASLNDVRHGFHSLRIEAGRQVPLGDDGARPNGAVWSEVDTPNPQREAWRAGHSSDTRATISAQVPASENPGGQFGSIAFAGLVVH